jgi:hypothetical protein
MVDVFQFGERIDGYDVPVLNEREVRASAGILFLFAMIAFMNAWLTGDFYLTRIFVIAFLIDFSIRIFVNPQYAPTMVTARLVVRRQQPEYVGAPQKRFAWSIGLLLALTMSYLIVVNNLVGPLNLFVCLTCLLLLFFESAFGICIACKVYNLAFKERARLCPGNVCEVKQHGRNITTGQLALTFAFLAAIAATAKLMPQGWQAGSGSAAGQAVPAVGDCRVPDWAAAIGHADKWRLHHNCRSTGAVAPAAGRMASADRPTVEIIAMAHPPVQSALKPLREWLANRGGRLRVVEIDAESLQGGERLEAVGLKGHVPILVLIDGQYRYQRPDGARVEFLNFPAAADNPLGVEATWSIQDVETALTERMK